jgi:hypothetical protein
MKVLRRKILLDDLKSFDDGLGHETITATSIYMKVEMIQTIDDLGMVTDLPFIPNGGQCAQFAGTIIVTDVTCYDPNSPAPSNAYIKPTVYGGQPPFNFTFYNGSNGVIESVQTSNNTYTLYNQPAGDYTVDVVDNLGCSVTLTGTSQNLSDAVSPTGYVILNQPYGNYPANVQIPFEDITETISVCETVDITLGVNDSQQYQDILWSTNETTDTIEVAQNGNYSFQASNGTCFGESPSIDIFIYSDNASQLESQLIIEPDTDVSGLQGSGTQQDPYILPCNPETTTTPRFRARLQSGVNPANFDCINSSWYVEWPRSQDSLNQEELFAPFTLNQSQELIADPSNSGNDLSPNQCPPDRPCSIFLQSRGCGCTNTVLVQSNRIWVAYENNLNCQPLSENPDLTGG